jgi:hypothetical protein
MLTDYQEAILLDAGERFVRYHSTKKGKTSRQKRIRKVLRSIKSAKLHESRIKLYWDLHGLIPMFYYATIKTVTVKTLRDILKATESPPTNTIDLSLDWRECSEQDWEEYSSEEIINVASRVRSPQIRLLSLVLPTGNTVPANLTAFLARIECRRIKLQLLDHQFDSREELPGESEPRESKALDAVFRNSAIEVFIHLF